MTASLLRERAGAARVTNVELFFDLVYVFAVTQLSHYLLHRPTPAGALQTAVLLAMVWLAWAYTAWVTNWLDPERIPVRLLLLTLALVSLTMSAALPTAFGRFGLVVGGAYAVMQVGRSLFMVIVLRGQPLRANYQRILAWCVVSGALAVAGGIVTGPARGWLWLAAVSVDVLGGIVGFYTPGLVLGGTALFIAGHAAFKLAVWRVVSWPRVGAIVVLGLLGLVAGDLPALALGLCAVVVVVGVAAIDYRWRLSSPV